MVAQDYFAQKDQWLAEKKDLEDAVFCLKIAVSGQCVFQFCKQLHVEGHKQLTSNSTLENLKKDPTGFRCQSVAHVCDLFGDLQEATEKRGLVNTTATCCFQDVLIQTLPTSELQNSQLARRGYKYKAIY